jgi:hypothetical protein
MAPNPLIALIPEMNRDQRYAAAKNATRIIETGDPRKADAEAALQAIESFEIDAFRPRRMKVGVLDWEPHDGQYVMRGFHGDEVVATITYTDTHTSRRKNVFELRVGGILRGDPFHHVADARTTGSRLFEEERGRV